MQTLPFTRTALRMSAGVIVWAAHFTAIYAFAALACARGYSNATVFGLDVVSLVVVGTTAVALAALMTVAVSALRSGLDAFENWMTACVAGLAAIAIVWEGLFPVFMVPACN